jgi:hypothetical protein
MNILNENQDLHKEIDAKNSGVIKSIMVEQEEKTRTAHDPLIVIGNALNQLKDRDRDVLVARYGIEKPKNVTLEEVGNKFGVTRERVRQIEAAAIKKLASKPSKDLSSMLKTINSFVNSNGGLVGLGELAKYLKVDKDERKEMEKNALMLAMDVNTEMNPLKKSKELRTGWMKKDFKADLIPLIIKVAEEVLFDADKTLDNETIWKNFGDIDSKLQTKINSLQLIGIMSVSTKFAKDRKDKWGLTTWPTVSPKRIRDKVFLILEADSKPMHFKDITDEINIAYPAKTVLNRTVHNELIGDKRFVLVGRGIYALKSWGYKPGVVADVIIDVLKDAGTPLTVSEITEKVLKKRKVKPNTVVANLQDKEKFKKQAKGLYTLAN